MKYFLYIFYFYEGRSVIDCNGYRLNVGIVICNINKQVLLAKRYKQQFWQFPQGGICFGETAEQAMFRELFEEIGLNNQDVKILSSTNNWLYYNIPKKFVRKNEKPICIGQKQKWFLLELKYREIDINLKLSKKPEFDNWKWVNLWYPISQVALFKRHVYRKVLKKFSYIIVPLH